MFIYERCSLIEISLYQLTRADRDGVLEKNDFQRDFDIEW